MDDFTEALIIRWFSALLYVVAGVVGIAFSVRSPDILQFVWWWFIAGFYGVSGLACVMFALVRKERERVA